MKCIKKNDMTKFFIFKQKTTYEMRISEWSSNVCSSDLQGIDRLRRDRRSAGRQGELCRDAPAPPSGGQRIGLAVRSASPGRQRRRRNLLPRVHPHGRRARIEASHLRRSQPRAGGAWIGFGRSDERRVGKACVSTGRSRGERYK